MMFVGMHKYILSFEWIKSSILFMKSLSQKTSILNSLTCEKKAKLSNPINELSLV